MTSVLFELLYNCMCASFIDLFLQVLKWVTKESHYTNKSGTGANVCTYDASLTTPCFTGHFKKTLSSLIWKHAEWWGGNHYPTITSNKIQKTEQVGSGSNDNYTWEMLTSNLGWDTKC